MKINKILIGLFLIVLGSFYSCNQFTGIEISNTPVSQNFMGHGVEWSAYPHDSQWGNLMTDEKLEMVYKRLDYMKPRIVRLMDVAGWRYFKGVDAKGNPILDFESREIEMVCKLLDYCQKNNINVIIGDYGVPGFWGYPGKIDRVDDPRFVQMTIDYLNFLIKEKGYTCITSYIITNEPNGDWACTKGDWEQWKAGVLMFVDAFKEAGLDLDISAPDVVEMADKQSADYTGRQWVEMSVEQMDDVIDHYNVHCYADVYFVREGKFQTHYQEVADIIKPTGKRMIFGEIGVLYKTGELGKEYAQRVAETPFASEDSQLFNHDYRYGVDAIDAVIQSMKVGFHGASAWMLDDAMHTMDDLGAKDQLKVWGFWNSLGKELTGLESEEEIRPWFFTWSLMCRYFTPGMDVYNELDASAYPNLRIVAGKGKEGTTIAIVNASETSYEFNLKMSVTGDNNMDIYNYVKDNYQVDKNSFPVVAETTTSANIVNGKEIIKILPRSFKLLTNVKLD